jgi:hypothetical protein
LLWRDAGPALKSRRSVADIAAQIIDLTGWTAESDPASGRQV